MNDAPTISDTTNQSTNEDTQKSAAFTIADVDHTVTCASSMAWASSNGSVLTTGGMSIV